MGSRPTVTIKPPSNSSGKVLLSSASRWTLHFYQWRRGRSISTNAQEVWLSIPLSRPCSQTNTFTGKDASWVSHGCSPAIITSSCIPVRAAPNSSILKPFPGSWHLYCIGLVPTCMRRHRKASGWWMTRSRNKLKGSLCQTRNWHTGRSRACKPMLRWILNSKRASWWWIEDLAGLIFFLRQPRLTQSLDGLFTHFSYRAGLTHNPAPLVESLSSIHGMSTFYEMIEFSSDVGILRRSMRKAPGTPPMVWNNILEVVYTGFTLAVLLPSTHSKIRCNSRTNIQRIWEMNITQHLGHFHLHDSARCCWETSTSNEEIFGWG